MTRGRVDESEDQGDLHANDHIRKKQSTEEQEQEQEQEGFEAVDGTEIWFDDENNNVVVDDQDQDLLDVNDQASIFYSEFPTLPDFPCMSSTSSSSSTPAPVKATTCSATPSSSSASSAASWAVLKSDADEDTEKRNSHINLGGATTPAALSSTASMDFSEQPQNDNNNNNMDCMDMMDTFGYMDLLETDEFLDPSSIFHNDHQSVIDEFQQELMMAQPHTAELSAEVPMGGESDHQGLLNVVELGNNDAVLGSNTGNPDDMASVFLEWLRSNRETVSAEDLRSVKIKKSTIESAARRLGGGKEAMKQLLKLVLEWVQTNHLQRRRSGKETSPFQQPDHLVDMPFHSSNPNPSPDPNYIVNSVPVEAYDPSAMVVPLPAPQAVYQDPVVGYMGDPFVCGSGYQSEHYNNGLIDSAQTWPSSHFSQPAAPYCQFPDNTAALHAPQGFGGFGASQYDPYHHGHYCHDGAASGGGDQRLVRLGSSATKEARKKRMARQRRLLSHHRHHNHNNQNHHQHQHQHHHHHHSHNQQIIHQQNQTQQGIDQQQQHAMRSLTTADNCAAQANNPVNWPVYWPAVPSAPQPPPAMIPVEPPPPPPMPTPGNNNNVFQVTARVSSVEKRQVGTYFDQLVVRYLHFRHEFYENHV